MITNIDGDSIVYANAFAVENEGTNATWMLHYNLDKKINSIINNTQCSDYTLYLSGKGNFREKLATISPYKGFRKNKAKPIYYKEARDYLLKTYKSETVDGMEAEDTVSIKQYESLNDGYRYGDTTIMAHIDKDLNNCAGFHYNFDKQTHYELSFEEADRNYWKQVLTGDWQCDGIPGLKGVGAKTAEKILEGKYTWEEMEEEVKYQYHDKAQFNGDRLNPVFETQLQGKITHTHTGVLDVFHEIKQLVCILREYPK